MNICEKIGKVDIIRRLKLGNENPHNMKDWPEFDSNMLQLSKSNLCSLFECIVRL